MKMETTLKNRYILWLLANGFIIIRKDFLMVFLYNAQKVQTMSFPILHTALSESEKASKIQNLIFKECVLFIFLTKLVLPNNEWIHAYTHIPNNAS